MRASRRSCSRLAFQIAGQARQDRRAARRHDAASLRDHRGVGDGFGQVGERFLHHLAGADPVVGRALDAVVILDIFAVRDAQQRIVRIVKAGVGVAGGVGRHQRQMARIGKIDQRVFGQFFRLHTAPRQFDVQPAGKIAL